MSIPVLKQVYDEVRRLAIAGSVTAPGDFRLKKLTAPLEQAGPKAPVFAKVAQGVQKLVESTEKTSAEALLELSVLVNAILYTQGDTSAQGELQPIETRDLGQHQAQASARVLKPLLEALTTTGSGRLEIITDAYERGAFRDLRLVEPAFAAIDDPYPEIATLIRTKVLPMYGKAIVPGLRDSFDLKGRGGHVHRLLLMHRLDPEGSREIVMRALDEGSKEIRVAAIECLGDSPEDLAFLLEQAKAKAKDVRAAALTALSKSDADEAVAALCKAIKGADLEMAVNALRGNRNSRVLGFVLEEAQGQLNALLASKEKDKAKLGKEVIRLVHLIDCLNEREEPTAGEFLINVFAKRDQLAAVKGEPSGQDLVRQLVSVMARGNKTAQQTLVDAHATLSAEELGEALLAAIRLQTPAEVYEQFSPYLAGKLSLTKKGRDDAAHKRKAVADVLTALGRRLFYRVWSDGEDDEEGVDPAKDLDPRWLDLAVKNDQLELVQALARPGHAAANKFLSATFDAQLKKTKDPWDLTTVISAMVAAQHPGAADAIIATITKHAKSTRSYGLYGITMMISKLPPEAAAKFEAILPSLPEKLVDSLLDPIAKLKSRK